MGRFYANRGTLLAEHFSCWTGQSSAESLQWNVASPIRTSNAAHLRATVGALTQPHCPSIVPLWWTLWIIGVFVAQALFRTALRADTVDELLASSWMTFVSDALDLPLCIAAMVVVTKLQAWQAEKRRRLAIT